MQDWTAASHRLTKSATKPRRQFGEIGRHPSSRLAFALEPLRTVVIIATPPSPVTSVPSHTGTSSGGFAPAAYFPWRARQCAATCPPVRGSFFFKRNESPTITAPHRASSQKVSI